MGVITHELRDGYGAQVGLIPPDMIARLPQEELTDRLVEAKRLYTKAARAETPDVSAGYRDMARLICKAAPRDETELLTREWTDKAKSAHTGMLASACLEKAAQIRRANPPAPRVTPVAQTPEQLEKAAAVAKLREDIEQRAAAAGPYGYLYKVETAEGVREAAAAHAAAVQRAEDRKYADALAGRRVWTFGDQCRWDRENGKGAA